RRLLDWYLAGLGPAQYLVDVICRARKTFGVTWAIGHEAPTSDKIASAKDRWKPRAQGKRKDAHEIGEPLDGFPMGRLRCRACERQPRSRASPAQAGHCPH